MNVKSTKKETCYFSHDANAKDDFKIMLLIEELGLPCQLDNLKVVNNIFFVPETNVFTLLKSHYKVALLDSYLSSKDLIENIVQYHQEWRQKGGVELFKANNKRLRFAKMVIKLIDDLEPIRKALL